MPCFAGIAKGVPNINQDTGSSGFIFRPSKKVVTLSLNRGQKNYEPVVEPTDKSHDLVKTPTEESQTSGQKSAITSEFWPKEVMTPP